MVQEIINILEGLGIMEKEKITFTLEQIEEAMESNIGFCIQCGAERECCEPDAREYPCDACGAKAVYGAEELAIMGLVE